MNNQIVSVKKFIAIYIKDVIRRRDNARLRLEKRMVMEVIARRLGYLQPS